MQQQWYQNKAREGSGCINPCLACLKLLICFTISPPSCCTLCTVRHSFHLYYNCTVYNPAPQWIAVQSMEKITQVGPQWSIQMVAVIDHHDPHTCTHNCLKNGCGSRTENREGRKARGLALENNGSWVRMPMIEPAVRLITVVFGRITSRLFLVN